MPSVRSSGNHFLIKNGETSTSVLNCTAFGANGVSDPEDDALDTLFYRLNNIGGTAMHITGPIVFTGAGAENFVVRHQDTNEIAPGGFAAFNLGFDPVSSATGLQIATVNIPTDAPGQTTYTFTVSGVASTENNPEEVDIRVNTPTKSIQKKCNAKGVCKLKVKLPLQNVGNTDMTSGILRIYLTRGTDIIDDNALQLPDVPLKKLRAPLSDTAKLKTKKVKVNFVIPDEEFIGYYFFAFPTDGSIERLPIDNFNGVSTLP